MAIDYTISWKSRPVEVIFQNHRISKLSWPHAVSTWLPWPYHLVSATNDLLVTILKNHMNKSITFSRNQFIVSAFLKHLISAFMAVLRKLKWTECGPSALLWGFFPSKAIDVSFIALFSSVVKSAGWWGWEDLWIKILSADSWILSWSDVHFIFEHGKLFLTKYIDGILTFLSHNLLLNINTLWISLCKW